VWTSIFFRSFFPANDLWQKSAPFYATNTYLNERTPEIYVSAGDKDTWGFYEGAKHFAELAKANGVSKVVWEPVAGGMHHEYNAEGVADFLIP
jgi:hypothetical protein